MFKSPDSTMSVMYVRSAFGILIGDGYSQYEPGSKAYKDLYQQVIIPSRAGTPLLNLPTDSLSKEGVYLETLHPPGWSLTAAVLTKAFGGSLWRNMQVITATIDALCIFLLFRLLIMWNLEESIIYSSLWLYSLFPPILYNAVCVKPTGFLPFFVLSVSLLFYQYFLTNKWKYLIFAAVINGIATLFRAEYLLFLPFLCLLFTKGFFKNINLVSTFQYVGRPVVVLLMSILVLVPWGIRNYQHFGKFIITSSGAGCTLVTGLGTYPNPWGFGPSDDDRNNEARAAGYSGAFDLDADGYFMNKFLNAIKEEPLAYLGILGRRTFAGLIPAYSWGIAREEGVSFTEFRSTGKSPLLLGGKLLKNYWSDILSALLMVMAHIGLLLFFIKYKDQPFSSLLLLIWSYSILIHVVTVLVAPFYVIPSIFTQIIGLLFFVFYIGDKWRGMFFRRKNI